jgi:putative membrane protein
MHGVSKIVTLAALTLLVGSTGVLAASTEMRDQRGQLSERDYKFVHDNARGGLLEVQLGELARQKAESPAVRQFGERMVADHSKANDQLKQIIAQKNAALPVGLSHHQNAEIERLQKLSGREFDRQYVDLMVKDHKMDVKEFQDAAKDLSDPDLRTFAKSTLPILEEHLRMARDLEGAIRK